MTLKNNQYADNLMFIVKKTLTNMHIASTVLMLVLNSTEKNQCSFGVCFEESLTISGVQVCSFGSL